MMTENKNHLSVSESFFSIQGEGQTMGHPSFFVRLSGCNLLCKSKNWICDSIEVWKKGIKTDFIEVVPYNYIQRLRNGAHLIITGGEPMLHQKKITEYLKWFWLQYNFRPIIEIETNGTILPTLELSRMIDYWNVSPKLENSGERTDKRVNKKAIDFLQKQNNVMFKFVINNKDDVLGILTEYNLEMDNVWLMPAGMNQEQLSKTRKFVAELAIKMNVRFSDRLHVGIWNEATGV